MKSILQTLIVCVVLTLLQVEVYGQRTTIYHENFSGEVTNVTKNAGSQPWQTKNNPIKTASYSKASDGAYLTTGSSAGTYVIELGYFSAGGYEDIYVSWGGKRTGEPTIKLEYSYNNGVFVEVKDWADVDTTWSKANAGTGISLPTCFNKGKIKLRWTYVATSASTTYSLDDITVSGVPHAGTGTKSSTSTFRWSDVNQNDNPVVAATNGSPNYYEKDGVKMQWSQEFLGRALRIGQRFISTDIQSKATFAIEQKNASPSSDYSKTKLYFSNTSVKGLSFIIFDVDRTGNTENTVQQFVDVVEIVGYRNTSPIPIYPQKQHAQVTRYHDFVAGGGGFQFKSKDYLNKGINVGSQSPEGDITVTFHEAVDRIEVNYFNDATPIGKVTDQGIFISDLSWRSVSLPTPEVDNNTPSAPSAGVTPTPLPVTLVSFEVKKIVDGAKLEWATASEINNERFVVERSFDGKTFEAIGEVKGAGNSSTLEKYSFLDSAPKAGTNYYRLTQHDFDGKSETSKTIYLTYSGTTSSVTFSAYPNPATEDLTIKPSTSTEADQTFYILNTAGNLVKTVVLPKNQTSVQLSVRELASGLYLVKSDKAVSKFFKR